MSRATPLQTQAAKPQPLSNSTHASLLLQRKCACGSRPGLAGECEECGKLQRKSLIPEAGTRHSAHDTRDDSSVPPIVHEILRSPGQPLDAATRAFMEPRFGHNFSQVRVFTGAPAAESARAVNALAYAVGQNIVFGDRQYSPDTHHGRNLLAHELTHTIQQPAGDGFPLRLFDSLQHEQEADAAAEAVYSHRPMPTFQSLSPGAVSRQKFQPDEVPKFDRNFDLAPQQFVKRMDAPAVREVEKCEQFPGGSTDCEVDAKTGTPTGKVTQRTDEKNPCTRPCVERHEAVHVKQMKIFCPELRDCYLAADKGKRPMSDCYKMAIFGMKERECEAYKVSVQCVEERLQHAKECKSKDNNAYGARKLVSEKCFRDKNCGS